MKKLLITFWLLIPNVHGLMGTDNRKNKLPSKEDELRTLYERAKKEKSYEGMEFSQDGSLEDFKKLRDLIIEKEATSLFNDEDVITKKSEDLISNYDKTQEKIHNKKNYSKINQDRPPITHYSSEFTRMKFAEDAKNLMQEEIAKKKGLRNYNQFLGKEHAEQQFYAQEEFNLMQEEIAKKKGLRNYNQFLGKEHAEQQFYAQEEFKKLKRENRTLATVAQDYKDAVIEKSIDFAAQVAVETVVAPMVIPPLQFIGVSLKKILYPDLIKQEEEQYLIKTVTEQEQRFLAFQEKNVHTLTNTNRRFAEILNDLDASLEQKGLDKAKQTALKNDIQKFNEEYSSLRAAGKIKTKEDKQVLEIKFELLLKKYNISAEDVALIGQRDQLTQDKQLTTQQEIEALKQLVAFTTHTQQAAEANLINTVTTIQNLAQKKE